jgi:dipeptidase E
MKLFLASLGLTDGLFPYCKQLLENTRSGKEVPFGYIIENATDYKGEEKQKLLRDFYEPLKEKGITFEYLDLREYIGKEDELAYLLTHADFIYIGGGNTFYLNDIIRASKFDMILPVELTKGLVYAGASAGATVLGPTLHHVELADDTTISMDPDHIDWNGLHILDFVILPHWKTERFNEIVEEINRRLVQDGYQTQLLTNEQALVISDDSKALVEE